MAQGIAKILVAFDFDMTAIEHDSDRFILQQLSPELLTKMDSLSASTQWTDLCNLMLGELHEQGFGPNDLLEAIRQIPFDPDMKSVFEYLKQQGHDIIIISDANTIYIEEITKAKGIHQYIDHVITNKAIFEPNGRLKIEWYSRDVHNCPNKCAPNICKGRELLGYLKSKSYDKIIYVGDGFNDFCPCTKIGANDVAMPRVGFGFARILSDPARRELVKAQIKTWASAREVLELIKTVA